MNTTQIPGSRWWRFDFHNHTPASSDFHPAERDTLQARDWLLAYMRAGVDAVVVSDHNTAAWVTQLQEALAALVVEQPPEWRPLALFPGLEISANEGVHLLAIFGPGTPRQTLDGLLGKLTGWAAGKPNHEQQCEQSAVLVAKAIHDSGGLAVAAHADKPRGIFVAPGVTGRSLDSLLTVLDAIELHDPQGSVAQASLAHWRGRAVVAGSDSPHRTSNAGRRCTWVKMSRPELAGLRLALLDPELALLPAVPGVPAPPLGGAQWIRSLQIENLQLRRQEPLRLDFNPAYNAVIGGRGSGKSTVIECLRLALAREGEIGATDAGALEHNFANFKKVAAGRNLPGMMRPDSVLVAEVQTGPAADDKLRFEWRSDGKDSGRITVLRPEGAGWVDTGLSSSTQMRAAFPVRIFSQKQVLALARHPQALLGLIDETLGPAKLAWQQVFEAARARLRQARVQLRALRAESARKPALELEHHTVSRKALVFKNANFGPLLQGHQRATRQHRALDDFHRLLEQDVATLRRALNETVLLEQTALTDFESVTPADAAVVQSTLRLRDGLAKRRATVAAEVAEMETLLAAAKAALASGDWQAQAQVQLAAYASEMQRLQAEGIDSAQEAAVAVAAVDRLAQQLASVAQFEARIPAAESEVAQAEEALLTARLQLTAQREELLQRVFASDGSLKVTLRGAAHGEGAVGELRELLGLGDRDKWPAIWEPAEEPGEKPKGVLYDATQTDRATDVGHRLLAMRHGLEDGDRKVLDTTIPAKLEQRLKALPPERFDELAGWFPEDEVTLSYRPKPGAEHKPLTQASDGQRAAAMLSFLLAQGEQPLLLDQPEDDLDNALVSELVVRQIREGKQARQLIVVTHNPNIVVNGDAELVLRMQFERGSIQAPQVGGMHERQVRESICEVMEGGRPAFEQRYKRILEDLNNLGRGGAGT